MATHKTFLEGMYLIFWSSWILVNIKCPAAQLFMVLLQTMSTRRQHYFLPAAAAKSLQSCPTLCDPIDGSPPGSPVTGILKARTLEGVAIAFSSGKLSLWETWLPRL